jgi:CRP-like cAMP-binding protein
MAKSSSDEYLERLRSVPLFAECDDAELTQIAGLGAEISLPAGQELTREGDVAHEAFLLMDGHATAVRGGTQIATFGPGDFFGEMALIGNRPRSATVTADDQVTIRAFHQTEFRQMMGEVPSIAVGILRIMAERLLEAEDAPTH